MAVESVLRIDNRKLRNSFMSAVQTILEQSGPDSRPLPDDPANLVEFLFLVWNEGRTCKITENFKQVWLIFQILIY